ncbi:MAG TPA: response regulator [Verrucomicrobiae bacterium]|jgi:two-component system response regulator HydG|nr:response regulator [Verrucomicrobiae bacterium]
MTDTTKQIAAKRILVVDDEPPIAKSLKMLLTMKGYVVETVESASLALEIFAAGKYDLVITDYALGTMTGLDLSRAIKEQCPVQPIIMISAYAELLSSRKERLVNINRLMGKPFSVEELLEAVAHIFHSS